MTPSQISKLNKLVNDSQRGIGNCVYYNSDNGMLRVRDVHEDRALAASSHSVGLFTLDLKIADPADFLLAEPAFS